MFWHNSCLNLSYRNFITIINIKQKEDVYAKIKEIQRKTSSIRSESFDVNQPSTNLQYNIIYLITFNEVVVNARLIELLFLEFTYLNVRKISVYSIHCSLHYMNSNYIKLFVFRHVEINGILLHKNFQINFNFKEF